MQNLRIQARKTGSLAVCLWQESKSAIRILLNNHLYAKRGKSR